METPQGHIIEKLKKQPASLPDDAYFTSLKSGLMEQVESMETTAPILPLYRRKWLMGGVAAAILALVVIPRWWTSEPPKTVVDWNSVSREELLAYVDEHIADFDAATIAAQLDNIPEWHTGIETKDTIANPQESRSEELFDELEDEEILEYLQQEVIELDDELLIGS